jgi:hypothetical protein
VDAFIAGVRNGEFDLDAADRLPQVAKEVKVSSGDRELR